MRWETAKILSMICGGEMTALQLLVLYSEIENNHHDSLDAKDFAVRMHHAHRMRDTSFPVKQSVSWSSYWMFCLSFRKPPYTIVSHDPTNGKSMDTYSNPGSEFVKL